jgi:hypothetical protein
VFVGLTLLVACSGSGDVVSRSGNLPFPDAGDVVDGLLAPSPARFETTWDGTTAQTLRFLDPVDPGVIVHPCGDTVCAADNAGAF